MMLRWLGWVFAAFCMMALLSIGDDATVSSHVGVSIHLSSNLFFSAIDRVVSLNPLITRTSDETSALVRASMNADDPPWLDLRGPPGAGGIPRVSDPAAGDAGNAKANPRAFLQEMLRPEQAPRENQSFATAFS